MRVEQTADPEPSVPQSERERELKLRSLVLLTGSAVALWEE